MLIVLAKTDGSTLPPTLGPFYSDHLNERAEDKEFQIAASALDDHRRFLAAHKMFSSGASRSIWR
jgi:hypothetical protein